MRLSCGQWCKIKEFIANLKCPNCFSTKVNLCDDEVEENAECEECDCKFSFKPDVPGSWE